MAWFTRSKENISDTIPKEMPDGLWTKCPSCSEVIYKRQLEENFFTCLKCGFHFRIGHNEYSQIIFDQDTFVETNLNLISADPLEFVDTKSYKSRIQKAVETMKADALTTGHGLVLGKKLSYACMNFNFIGGSMGSVVGEKFYRAAKYSLNENVPLLVICSSGGARMQEAALSLMQMAKTSAVLSELADKSIPYITLLTDPTTGGVTASYGMLGDVIIAEPGALIAFAGPRVIEQTIKRKLPTGFQRSEFLLDHGFIDTIVNRQNLKSTLKSLIDWFGF